MSHPILNLINTSQKVVDFIALEWTDREAIKPHFKKLTPAKQNTMLERIVFFEELTARSPEKTPELLILCPFGSFLMMVFSLQNIGGEPSFLISRFAGNEKVTSTRRKQPFVSSHASNSFSVVSELWRLDRHQNEAKPFVNPYALGDILYGMSSYEDTMISFYQVTNLTKKGVTVRPIRSIEKEADMVGIKAPLTGEFFGDPITCKVGHKGNIKIDKYETAYALAYNVVNGVRIYEHKSFTTYG